MMENLSRRVAILEKLLVHLAKWTKFDLQQFGPTVLDTADDDPGGKSSANRGSKAKRTARKSTSAVTRVGAISPIQNQILPKDGDRRGRRPRKCVRNMSPMLDDLGRGQGHVVEMESDVDVEIKMEPGLPFVVQDNGEILDEQLQSRDDPFSDNGDDPLCDLDPETGEDDLDYEIHPENSDFEPSFSESSDSDEDFETNVKKNKKSTTVPNRGKRKILAHAGRPRYRNFAPLHLPPGDSTAELNPLIRMDNLTREELVGKNVTIPNPRKPPKIRQKGPYPCPHCDINFDKKASWIKHQRKNHPKQRKQIPKKETKILQCPHCPRTFNFKSRYDIHLRIHTQEKPHLCYHCGSGFKQGKELNAHLRIMHPDTPREKRFKCDTCDKGYYVQNELVKHKKQHHGTNGRNELEVQCPRCNLIVYDAYKLKLHIRDVHDNVRRFSCHICGQQFKRGSHLRKHVAAHDKPNRRNRGPQKPMIRGTLLPTPESLSREGEGQKEGQEEKQNDDKMSFDKDNDSLRPYLLPIRDPLNSYSTTSTSIGSNVVKDFSMAYLQ